MMLLLVFKWRDFIFTFVEILFLFYLLRTDISKHVCNRKKMCRFVSAIILYLFIIISTYMQINIICKIILEIIMIVVIGVKLYEYSVLRSLIYAIIFIFSIVFGEMIVIFAFGLLGIDGIVSMEQHNAFTLQLLIISKCVIFISLFFLKSFFEKNFAVLRESWLVSISNMSLIVVFSALEYTLIRQNEVFDESYSGIMLISFIMLIFVFILNNLLWKYFIKLKSQEKQEALKQEELRAKSEYYYEKAKRDEEIREIYHDLKNHLILLKSEKLSAASTAAFVTKIDLKIKQYECFINTGNDFLDILLKDKMEKAYKKEIDLDVDIDFRDTEFMEPLDISSIFGNLFDNAIEACEKVKKTDKFIDLYVVKKNSMIIIKMENSTCLSYNRNFNTTKINKNMHGFGLKSIQKSLEKYNGTLQINSENGIFSAIALLPDSVHKAIW